MAGRRRTGFGLLAAVLMAALAPLPAAQAPALAREAVAAPFAAEAVREGDALLVSWSGPVRVDIFRLDRPDARPTRANRVARGATGGRATVPAPPSPRPYLLLRAADGRSLVVAERLLPLESGQNFRDLGGYPAAGGRYVAWGLLYRSGDPSTLSAADLAYLGRLGIATVCDLRSSAERAAAPSRLAEGRDLLVRDYALEMPDFGALFAGGPPTPEAARAVFARFYRELPFQFAQDYRRMFRALVEGRAPLAFNCSAGKDRTGVAAALLLLVLGASRETAIADYLLSDRYYRPKPPAAGAAADPSAAAFARLPPEVMRVFQGVDRAYLEAAFEAIDARPGGMDRYVAEDLGLSAADIATLRRRYLR